MIKKTYVFVSTVGNNSFFFQAYIFALWHLFKLAWSRSNRISGVSWKINDKQRFDITLVLPKILRDKYFALNLRCCIYLLSLCPLLLFLLRFFPFTAVHDVIFLLVQLLVQQ